MKARGRPGVRQGSAGGSSLYVERCDLVIYCVGQPSGCSLASRAAWIEAAASLVTHWLQMSEFSLSHQSAA